MRQIVYDNIIELIKVNRPVEQKTKNGTRYDLYGCRGNRILSLYQDSNKIKLFINDKLFASESLKKATWPFDQTYCHRHQLHDIKLTLMGQTPTYKYAPNFSAKFRGHRGATPEQVTALQVAWFKSYHINKQMCSMLGNGR